MDIKDEAEKISPEIPDAVNTDFLTEKIKKRPVSRRRLLKQLALTGTLAVIFGVIACFIFLLLEPRFSRLLNSSNQLGAIVIPEELPTEEISPQDMVTEADEKQELQQEIQQELQQELQQSVTANVTQSVTESLTAKMNSMMADALNDAVLGASDLELYRQTYDALKATAAQASRSIVQITGVTEGENWLEQYETYTSVSGLIVAAANREFLILCDGKPLNGADRLNADFEDGADTASFDAEILAEDTLSGYLMLRVNAEGLSDEAAEMYTACRMGSSGSASLAGEPIIAVGAPTGENGSICYGILTGNMAPIDLADTAYSRITTDIYTSTGASGIITDTTGKVLGMIDMSYNEKGLANQLCATGISELKTTISNLSAGKSRPYTGIHGSDLSTRLPESLYIAAGLSMSDSGDGTSEKEGPEDEEMPDGSGEDSENEPDAASDNTGFITLEGAYVTFADMDSPAMLAGIRSADVIVSVDNIQIKSFSDFADALWNWQDGETLKIGILRSDAEGYQKLTIEVTPVTNKEYHEMLE